MAKSLAHKFGQIIGDLLELALLPKLERFVKINNLYLDRKGKRKARKGKKVSWFDTYENKHDLDFVIERGGSDTEIGMPVAFIEIAWRRYTKHSRNKVGEIQCAIGPLYRKYQSSSPFLGVLLAGEFTEGSLTQLKTNGFNVLYFPYQSVVNAFKKVGIIADFNENTEEEEFRKKIESWENITNKSDVAKELLKINKKNIDEFFNSLTNSVSRFIERIVILPLHGQETFANNIAEAIDFLKNYSEEKPKLPIIRYEIIIKYNTGDRIEASFKDKKDTIKFLETYL